MFYASQLICSLWSDYIWGRGAGIEDLLNKFLFTFSFLSVEENTNTSSSNYKADIFEVVKVGVLNRHSLIRFRSLRLTQMASG
jgi:hypothetical protein